MSFLFKTYLSEKKWQIYLVFAFVVHFLYSYLLNISNKYYDNFITIFYIASILLIFFQYISSKDSSTQNSFQKSIKYLLLLVTVSHVGLFIGLFFSHAPDNVIWMPDSYTYHIPQSLAFLDVIKGKIPFDFQFKIDGRYYIFHIVSAVSFLFFGTNIFASGLSLFIGKILTTYSVYILGKKVFNDKTGLVAAFLYAFVPTNFFYSISFYKEVYVQLFVTLSFIFSYSVFIEKNSKSIIYLIISLLLLFNERFHLFCFFLFAIIIIAPFVTSNKKLFKFCFIIVFATALISQLWIFRYEIQHLDSLRYSYNNFPDIDKKFNTEIPYFLALIKITFTPFFTLSKFDMFYDFSYLLIWGSFVNQIVIASALLALLRNIKNSFATSVLLWTPFICFLVLFAYIGPAQGRLRDSFYPLISVYAAFTFVMGLRIKNKE